MTSDPEVTEISVSSESITTSTSTGNAFVMPQLVGKKVESVINSDAWKERLEFDINYDYSETYDAGYIFEQDIDQGTMLYPITTVKIFVSKGLSVVEIPYYYDEFGSNMSKDDYITLLDELNIKYELRTVATPYYPSGHVVGVYCSENGEEAGGKINVMEGYTLFVDVSEFAPDTDVFG